MKVHYLQHVSFEGPGSLEQLLLDRGHQVSGTRLFSGEKLPPAHEVDWLVILGGPLSVHDEAVYPWLAKEKEFIVECISLEKKILGFCLGAQLIAEALGADVVSNGHREIGWFPVTIDPAVNDTFLSEVFDADLVAFHWHGDTFSQPPASVPVGYSEACINQGFVYDTYIAGFQFHLETTPEAARALIEYCSEELDGSRFVQSASAMLSDHRRFTGIGHVLEKVVAAYES